MKQDYYRQAYFYELERRDQLTARTNTSILLLSLLSSVIAWLLSKVFPPLGHWDAAVATLMCLAIISATYAVIRLVRFYFPRLLYQHAATAKNVAFYQEGLEKYYREIGLSDPVAIAATESDAAMMAGLVQVAEHNSLINDERSRLLSQVTYLTVVAFFIVTVGVCVFGIKQVWLWLS